MRVSRTVVAGGLCESLPKDQIVLDVLFDVITDPKLAKVLSQLSDQGYMIAVEIPPDRALGPGEADWADIVRLNTAGLTEAQLAERVRELSALSVELLASQVDTYEHFELCNRHHFDLYQGYFFCEPNLGQGDIPANRLAALQVLTKLRQPDISMDGLDETIGHDVTLSYKLLRYVNSAFIGINRTVDSVTHATRIVGMDRRQLWASLIMFSRMEDKPRELMITAMVRAAMCERLAHSAGQGPPEQFFTVGLLSVLDALMDRPMSEALEQLPLSQALRDALLDGKGTLGRALGCVPAYERNDWGRVEFQDTPRETIRTHYLDSLGWARRIAEGLMI